MFDLRVDHFICASNGVCYRPAEKAAPIDLNSATGELRLEWCLPELGQADEIRIGKLNAVGLGAEATLTERIRWSDGGNRWFPANAIGVKQPGDSSSTKGKGKLLENEIKRVAPAPADKATYVGSPELQA